MNDLDRVLENIFTPENADDCNDPTELGMTSMFGGHWLTPDQTEELADRLRDHAEAARAAAATTDEHAAFTFCHDLIETPWPYVGWATDDGGIAVTTDTLDALADNFDWALELTDDASAHHYVLADGSRFPIRAVGVDRYAIPALTWQPCSPASCTEHSEEQRAGLLEDAGVSF